MGRERQPCQSSVPIILFCPKCCECLIYSVHIFLRIPKMPVLHRVETLKEFQSFYHHILLSMQKFLLAYSIWHHFFQFFIPMYRNRSCAQARISDLRQNKRDMLSLRWTTKGQGTKQPCPFAMDRSSLKRLHRYQRSNLRICIPLLDGLVETAQRSFFS